MLFLNPWLLLALTGASIPVIVHLLRRQAAKPVEWGAMRFLMDTVSERRRRMEWEDLLLMAARCALLTLAALTIARPFVPPDAPAPWSFVIPAILLGIGLFGGSFVLGTARKRAIIRVVAVALFCLAAGMVVMEHWLNLRRFEASGGRDVALIIDASTSMTRKSATRTLFDDALDDARHIIKEAPSNTSFVVILGGPSPVALSNSPLSGRAGLLIQLDALQVLGGTFRAHEALAMATTVLTTGTHPNKDIVVLTDSQRHGWRLSDAGGWQSLMIAWNKLPAKPRLMLRIFPQAPVLRNSGIASVSTSRDLIGTDRPCLLRTNVTNTGNQPVTPGELLIGVDGKQIASEPLNLLVPGQSQTVETRHRFTTPGQHVVTAHLTGHDDIPGDDRADFVVTVRKALRVVLVDGNPGGNFFERAAGHTALALAPAAALVTGGEVGKDFLMDPVVVPAPDVTLGMLAGADVVVLADVARLPVAMAAALADRCAAGTGLLVLAGPRVEPAFYNTWDGPDGPLLPLELGVEAISESGVAPRPNSFKHAALNWASDERRSDLGRAVIRRWRKSSLMPGNCQLAATFGNSDPFLATRGYGRGRCVVATCAFDARSGNLPGRATFVALVQELVSWAAGGGIDWNIDSAWNPSVVLDSRSSGGLTARYFRRQETPAQAVLGRVDPTIDFNWSESPPGPAVPRSNFSVQWRATLLPQISGDYLLESQAGGKITVSVSGKTMLVQTLNQPLQKSRLHLEAGKPVPFEALYEHEQGPAHVRLFWTPPGGARQLIPSTAWIPVDDKSPPVCEATDPLGRTRKATISLGRRGRELRIDGPAVPGLYQVRLPADLRESITGTAGSEPLPVVVRSDITESRIDALTDDDLAQLRVRTDVILPKSTADILAVLSGHGFGREITRTVAVAAVLLLLLETALARWVSKSRRANDEIHIEFGQSSPDILEKGAWR